VTDFVWEMLEIIYGTTLPPTASVIDPACGDGVFLPQIFSSTDPLPAVKLCDAPAFGKNLVLTREQVGALITATCHYCGTPPATVKPTSQGPFLWNGIDRLHNDQGYTPENSVTCCRACNVAKNIMSIEAFAQWVERLASRVPHWHPKLPPQEVVPLPNFC